jgi:hypothetical protein
MKKAIIEQTRFNINLSNDETEGQTTFTRGNISYSENRPKDRPRVSRTAERYLEMAEIYFLSKLGAIRLNSSSFQRARD